MKIAICGSMQFAQEMINIKIKLEILGHQVILPKNTEKYAIGTKRAEDKWAKIEGDVIRNYYQQIKKCDAILVINITKNKIKNYLGGNALIEMAFAHLLSKKIYLLNPIPKMNYSDEIRTMKPVILNNNLKKIK